MICKGLLKGLGVVFLLCCAVAAFAGVPQTISYQGYLKNSSGVPVSTATSMTFSLYSSASGAGAVWSSTAPDSNRVSVTPVNGVYSVELGKSPQPALPVFSRQFWLGVTAGSDPEMRPLQYLASVPYALRSGCIPGDMITCYTGTPGSIVQGGICQTGTRTCLPDGSGFGSCVGEVTPVPVTGCNQPTCNDTVKNGIETDVDCGGGVCATCQLGKNCLSNSDCYSLYCSDSNTCATPSCTDTVKNGTETDVDCGGLTCVKCATGKACSAGSDCLSGVCMGGVCATPTCSDAVKNGTETDVDCGGSTCATKCGTGKACSAASDCLSGVCMGGVCQLKPSGLFCTGNSECQSGSCGTSGFGYCCSSSCITGGVCGATGCAATTGACVYPTSSTVAVPQSCSGHTLTPASTCNGSGGVYSVSSYSCPNNLICASSAACLTTCTLDSDCVSGYYCSGGACQSKKTNGSICSTGSQCATGFCTDGVCCDSACDGTCQLCNSVNAPGSCQATPDGVTDPNSCISPNACYSGSCSTQQ